MRSFISSPTRSLPQRSRATRARRMSLECLEGRELLATLSVANATLNEIGAPSAFIAAGSGGLDSPFGMALGPDGNVYVACNGGAVRRYNVTVR
ncbi:MAG: hypothetical protein U0835_00800 [Isosphaeraceae bacterium]